VEVDGGVDEDGRGIIDIGARWFSPEICLWTGFDDNGIEFHDGR